MSEITHQAEQLLAGRVESVRQLEEARDAAVRARDHLASVERTEDEAWSAATSAGWTAAELKTLGFHAPATRRGGRPRATSKQTRHKMASHPE